MQSLTKNNGSIPRNACVAYGSVTDGLTDGRTDGQSDPYVSLCFAGNTKMLMSDRQHTDRWTRINL